jgi:hypothetical protein
MKLLLPLLLLCAILWLRLRVTKPLVVRCDGGEGQWIDEIETMLSERSSDA